LSLGAEFEERIGGGSDELLESIFIPGLGEWWFGFWVVFWFEGAFEGVEACVINNGAASVSLVSIKLSELEVLASHIKWAVLKCWIRCFSKSIYNFILQLCWIIITNNTVASSTSLSHSFDQVLITPVSNTEGKDFGAIILRTHWFAIVDDLIFVADLSVGKNEDSLLVLSTVESWSGHQWAEDVGSTEVGIKVSGFVDCSVFGFVVVIVDLPSAPIAVGAEAEHTEFGTTWETLQEEDHCIVRDLHSVVAAHWAWSIDEEDELVFWVKLCWKVLFFKNTGCNSNLIGLVDVSGWRSKSWKNRCHDSNLTWIFLGLLEQ